MQVAELETAKAEADARAAAMSEELRVATEAQRGRAEADAAQAAALTQLREGVEEGLKAATLRAEAAEGRAAAAADEHAALRSTVARLEGRVADQVRVYTPRRVCATYPENTRGMSARFSSC